MQLIYGYVENDDDNGDEIDGNSVLDFKDKCSFISHTTYTWYEIDMPLISECVHSNGYIKQEYEVIYSKV